MLSGADLETSYQRMCRKWGIIVVFFELWPLDYGPSWGHFDFSGLIYNVFLSLKRLKLKSIYIIPQNPKTPSSLIESGYLIGI
jgi:hypothetical protein